MADGIIALAPPVLDDAARAAVAEVLDGQWLAMGERVRAFEERFAAAHGVADGVAVSSATAALTLALAAHDIGPGDEVLVPSMTFVATANVVVAAGATPVFVDIDDLTEPHVSTAAAQRLVGPRTRAAIVMHYGGYRVPMDEWRRFADAHGLLLFEDAAHASGLAGVGSGTDGAAFSFFANKNMTTAEGGMLLIPDDERRERARRMRSHGMTASSYDRDRGRAISYDVVDCGFNFRLDELRAALGLVQLEQLPGWNARRRVLSDRYRDLVSRVDSCFTVV